MKSKQNDSFRSHDRIRFFSLIELLVTLAVIAILAGMLLPVLHKARSKAYQVQCKSQLSQIGKYMSFYVNDFDGWHTGADWNIQFQSLYSPKKAYLPILRCPGDPEFGLSSFHYKILISYSINGRTFANNTTFAYQSDPSYHFKNEKIVLPSSKVFLGENTLGLNPADAAYANPSAPTSAANFISNAKIQNKHERQGNLLCADGHIETIRLPGTLVQRYDMIQDYPHSANWNLLSKTSGGF